MHVVPLHVPLVHTFPAQQGSPVKPQDWQVEVAAAQTTSVPEQTLPGQHASPKEPQVVHVLVAV
jgi:hypothetical protein